MSRSGTRRRLAPIGVTLALVGTLTLGPYAVLALLAPVPTVSPVIPVLDVVETSEGTVTLPGSGGAAIALADGDRVLAARGLDEPRVLASITKVITALVVLEERPIEGDGEGPDITLTAADARLVQSYIAIGGSFAPAPVGTVLTQREIIELMIVRSANNYADTLALWAFGSIDAYLRAARSWLERNGLERITVADTTGFSLSNRATPRDLLALARIAAADPVIAAAAATPELVVDGVGVFQNTNQALGTAGVTGLKTGTLGPAVGANLLFSGVLPGRPADAEPVAVVGVVLGQPDQGAVAVAVQRLMTTAADDLREVTLIEEGEMLAQYATPWGDSVEVRSAITLRDLVWGGIRSRPAVAAPALIGADDTGLAGEVSAVMRWGGRTERIPVTISGAIDPPPLDWRLLQPLREWGLLPTTS
ncbi:MAG: hypothetical protein LDL15_07845 [Yonghaparkia sp.]|nr:hypothetical protein [Microcella sp.]